MAAPGEEVRFATDSSLEGDGFEPSVPCNRAEAFSRLPPFDVSVTRYRESGSFIQWPTGRYSRPRICRSIGASTGGAAQAASFGCI
jgi:hypothetical protein